MSVCRVNYTQKQQINPFLGSLAIFFNVDINTEGQGIVGIVVLLCCCVQADSLCHIAYVLSERQAVDPLGEVLQLSVVPVLLLLLLLQLSQ